MTPSINVNLKTCDSGCSSTRPGQKHYDHCAASPILIPCAIPCSVTVSVGLGECNCVYPALKNPPVDPHRKTCPARPVRVACSISGATWAESEVTDLDVPGRIAGTNAVADVWSACRERWRLVQMLVLGHPGTASAVGTLSDAIPALQAQRDAVYAALVGMARAEEAHRAAEAAATAAIYGASRVIRADTEPESQELLGRYVGRLVEQVGVL